jgi:hypothetical protein
MEWNYNRFDSKQMADIRRPVYVRHTDPSLPEPCGCCPPWEVHVDKSADESFREKPWFLIG